MDTITDFLSGTDKLEFSAAGFGGGLTAGMDPATVFGSSNDATFASATERFHFDSSTSTLYFDADGSDPGAPVALVQFQNNVVLRSGDWLIA
jgi:Ca2+-binding RTX toxin-like protein